MVYGIEGESIRKWFRAHKAMVASVRSLPVTSEVQKHASPEVPGLEAQVPRLGSLKTASCVG